MNCIIVIPARMDSERLPGKPMIDVAGWPLMRWTYENARHSRASAVYITSPDTPILDYCDKNGIPWIRTTLNCKNGTQRVAEAMHKIGTWRVEMVLNLQVDEPLVSADELNRLFSLVLENDGIGTLYQPLTEDSNDIVKVVLSEKKCHWFSRARMRGSYHHIGVYAFTRVSLRAAGTLMPSELSRAESLEQLTWIEHGLNVRPLKAESRSFAINTWEDIERFKRIVS